MGRYDVYANPVASERKHTPYVVDVQNSHIDELGTRVVIPLRREASFGPRASGLHPLLTVSAENMVLDTSAIGAVPSSELRKPVTRLSAQRADIQTALDTLFGAY